MPGNGPHMKREWNDGGQGIEGKNPSVCSAKSVPRDHPILSELEKQLGILSDSSVHLTPEYFGSQHWNCVEPRIDLRYFISEQRTIECSLITLIGTHANILRIFDALMARSSLTKNGSGYGPSLKRKGNR